MAGETFGGRTRREFLIGAGSGLAVGLLAPRVGGAQDYSEPTAPALRVRRDVTSAEAKNDLDSLRAGVAAMKKLISSDPADPRGWVLQAFIHGNCTGFTKCQHGNWYFLPWHRSFLYYFEQLVQHFSSNPGFALPYWDWSRTSVVPGSFYGAANPLDDDVSIRASCSSAPTAGRGRAANDPFSPADMSTYVGPAVIDRIQQNPDFSTYGGGTPGGGELERTPHNFVHRWVGAAKSSNMVRAYSPLDPIFWMHHCNIDRLYSNWLARPGHFPPPDSAWQGKSFTDFVDRDGNPAGGQFTCGMTVDSKVMGYVYDQGLQVPLALAAGARAVARQQVMGTITASRSSMEGGVMTFVTEAAPQPQLHQAMNAAALGVRDHVVRLRIEGVDTPSRQDTGVHVFLGPDITADTPVTAPGYVGSFTFFGGHEEGGHEHEGADSVLLNASEALRRLYGDTTVPPGARLEVSIVTRPLFEGVEAFASVEEVQPDRIHLEVVDVEA